MNIKIIAIAFVGVFAVSITSALPTPSSTKDEVNNKINDLEKSVTELKNSIHKINNEMDQRFINITNDATNEMDKDTNAITAELDHLKTVCGKNDDCLACFEDQKEIDHLLADYKYEVDEDFVHFANAADAEILTITKALPYDDKIKEFRAALEACKNEDEDCITKLGGEVDSYKEEVFGKDQSEVKVKNIKEQLETKVVKPVKEKENEFNSKRSVVKTKIETCANPFASSTEAPSTSSQTKIMFNMSIVVCLLVASKIFA